MFLSCGLEEIFAKVVHSQATVGWSSHWNFVLWAFAWQWLSEQTCLSAGSHGILSTPERSSQAHPSKAHISYLKLTILLLFWYVAHIRQLQKTTSSLRHSNSEGWLSRQLPSSSLWMVELFSGTSQAQKFSIMLANLINFNIQVLLGIQTSHLCFQAFAKVLNRSSVLSSIHLEKSTADAMHKHYMQEIKTPKGDLASPWSNLQRLVLMQWWYQRCI